MIRQVAAVALAIFLTPSLVFAQAARLTVTVQSADVHKYPSVGSPIIGHAAHGTVLEVQRDLGSWVAVPWTGGDNGVAYLHVLTGSIARGAAAARNGNDPMIPPRLASDPPPESRNARFENPRDAKARQTVTPASRQLVTPPSHVIGLGGRVGPTTMGSAVTARAWRPDQLGFQLAFARADMNNVAVVEHLNSMIIEPSVLYRFNDRFGDYLWMRPYVGVGGSVRHQSLRIPDFGTSTSKWAIGAQGFGGAEFAVAAMPRFTLSMDLGYHWVQDAVPPYDLNGMGVSIGAHWYIK